MSSKHSSASSEQPPANSTIPVGGGFRITEPNKVGGSEFQIVHLLTRPNSVNQGDKVTLHFIGGQGAHHVVTVQGVDTFELMRGQIHNVSFVANNPGTIAYICHVHLPNMVGQILVLPKDCIGKIGSNVQWQSLHSFFYFDFYFNMASISSAKGSSEYNTNY